MMMRRKQTAACLLALGLLTVNGSSHAFKLIKEDEAKQPPAVTSNMATRGITRGPGIKLVSPDSSGDPIKSPLTLKVAFEPRGGAKIDTTSVKVSYLKATPIDLLDRVKSGLSETGIDIANAEIPPGEHAIQVMLQDSEGRKSSTIINLTVAK